MRLLVLLAAFSAAPSGDAGLVSAGVGELRVFNARFDGRELAGIAVVCAEEGDVFVDGRLDTAATFIVRSVRTCEARKEIPFTVADYASSDSPPGPVRVRRGQCVGAPFVWRLFRYPLPAQSSCVEITVAARIRSAEGRDVEPTMTVITISP